MIGVLGIVVAGIGAYQSRAISNKAQDYKKHQQDLSQYKSPLSLREIHGQTGLIPVSCVVLQNSDEELKVTRVLKPGTQTQITLTQPYVDNMSVLKLCQPGVSDTVNVSKFCGFDMGSVHAKRSSLIIDGAQIFE